MQKQKPVFLFVFLLCIFISLEAFSQNNTFKKTSSFSHFIPETTVQKNKTGKILEPCSDIPRSHLNIRTYHPSTAEDYYTENSRAKKT